MKVEITDDIRKSVNFAIASILSAAVTSKLNFEQKQIILRHVANLKALTKEENDGSL